MFQRKRSLVVISFFLGATSLAFAHPGHSPRPPASKTLEPGVSNERTWTDATGKILLHGSFVAVKQGGVQIRRNDESLVNLKLSQFSEADQQWVMNRLTQIREANETIPHLSLPMRMSFVRSDDDEETTDIEDLALDNANQLCLHHG